ncbi:MAG: SDR family NAD(P)-dependent oxidoreductase, partial [Polaromonas sp.]|nr:SDR family NAD(P)-dependent oxidoreductase [Polaromonas sp.]
MSGTLLAAYERARGLAQDALVLGPAAELPLERLEAIPIGGRLLCLAQHGGIGGVGADEFLLRMALRGFIPETADARRSPAGAGPALETLNLFTRHGFSVRPARESDLLALLRMERRCWVPGTRTPGPWLRRRMAQFARGQLVLEQGGQVVGAVYSQRVDGDGVQGLDAISVHSRHRPGGRIVQLLALNVLPRVQDRGFGDLLLEFMLQRCAVMEGVTDVIGVTRCRDYGLHAGVAVEDYIRLRDARGQLVDPVLRFHELHGATIREVVPGYRPKDGWNRGCGVLVHYDVHGRAVHAASGPQDADGARPLRERLAALLNRDGREVPFDRPLFEAGLDSADLLGLREALHTELGVVVEPGFFFEFNTGERVLGYLQDVLGTHAPQVQAAGGTASPGGENGDAIAIVGMAFMFPGGATDPQRFWQLLWEGRDAIGPMPAGRWSWPPGIDPAGAHRGIDLGGFIEGVESFDARFFRISPREARQMDPQQRLALQLAWACVEDAAWPAAELAGSPTGVFIGASGSDYQQRWSEVLAGDVGADYALCGATAMIANRISYFLDLRGPSQQVDTACSSSLVALHQAIQALRLGQCGQALVGGVNVLCHPSTSIAYYKAGMLSPDGRCRTFDASANGYVRGEGAAMVLLKPLAAARRDGDRIHAVIRGTASNHGGQAAGLTVPNPAQQAQLVLRACADAGIGPEALGYIETHGTGTPLGDPVEVQGLRQAFEQGRAGPGAHCGLGSVKTNIGHLEAAAGLAGVIKTVLALQQRRLPASLHLHDPNPHLLLEGTAFHLQRERAEWPLAPGQTLRRAGVSSFGSGGTNAHAILEEYEAPQLDVTRHDGRPLAIVLSARDADRLRARVRQLLEALDSGQVAASQLPDLAFTLQAGRQPMPARLGVLASSMASLREHLATVLAGGLPDGVRMTQLEPDVPSTAVVRPTDQAQALAHWMTGTVVDWRSLYATALPQRIGLPTYPFAADRHWLPDPQQRPARPVAPGPVRGKPTGIVLMPVQDGSGSTTAGSPPQLPPAPALPPVALAPVAIPVVARPAARDVASTERIEKELAASLADALLMEAGDVRPDAQFVGLGLDSISGVEWVRSLNRRYGLSVAATVVYAHPSVRQLAAHLTGLMPGSAAAPPSPPPAAAAPAAPRTVSAPLASPPHAGGQPQPIAVVGMSGRYPGASDLNAFWDVIAEGRDAVTEVPPSRWDIACHYDPTPQAEGKTYGKWLGVLDGVDEFDPEFFGLSAAEAEVMDPQQRLFLQEAWRALEDAGIAPSSLAGSRSGVYLGLSNNEYAHLLRTQGPGLANRLGNSLAIAAARIAYRLDLKGPAMALDTACSSSLVATHLAVQALQAGQVDLALAGGVSLYLTPELHILMSSMGMLAPDGRCKPFDDGANGIVPGEGAGVLVLKRLADAERDGDPIHGVILACGINQDGKTNGITAPSLASQAELVRDLYQRHGIHPESLSYVEMHGTGTKLGDPIELEALATAFGAWTQRRQFCRIGSVKANIGHVTAAAGVAGMHKVLLAMRHGEFAPLPHFRTPNAHFDFAASPFVVGTARTAWEAAPGARRRAAVSSFGISGTNAHVVLEEWLAPPPGPTTGPVAPALIVLSARDDQRLRERAAQLADAVARHEVRQDQLAALSHTLQMGRDHMDVRLATAVDSLDQLQERLAAFVRGESCASLHLGRVRRDDPAWAGLADDEDAQNAARAWLRKGRHATVLDLWVQGYPMDWRQMQDGPAPRRISLPVYPFARERYWVPAGAGIAAPTGRGRLHPLLHRNDSTAAGLRFTSTFSGEEPVLRDHRVRGRPLLPAAAQLEMVRAALALAAELPEPGRMLIGPVAWQQPLAVDGGPVEAELLVRPAGNGLFEFELASGRRDARRVHCGGHARVQPPAAPQRVAMADLQARFNGAPVPAAQCYAAYEARGLSYGLAHRALEQLWVEGDEVLARWRLPPGVALEAQVLHPGVLDAALQAQVGWSLDGTQPSLPFALDRLEVLQRCPAQGWAWLRRTGGAAGEPPKLDIDLLDDEGDPCLLVRGFSSRLVPAPRQATDDRAGLTVQEMGWQPEPLAAQSGESPGWILLAPCFASHAGALQAARPRAQCRVLTGGDGIASCYQEAAAQVLALLQEWQRSGAAPGCLQLVLPTDGEGALLRGLAGMLQTARLENPALQGQVLLLPATVSAAFLAQAVAQNASMAASDLQVRVVDQAREVFRPHATEATDGAPAPWRSGAVYLITGGLGGIGMQLARDIARAARGATVVLSGRAPLDDARRSALAVLTAAGLRVVYRQADAADGLCVRGLVEGIVEEFGALHGVLHCAGVARDSFLLHKTPAQLQAVLAPKVAGLVALDLATASLPLEHLVLFSSISAVAGSIGQADYAAANGFMDAYSAHRNALVARGLRHGRTVAIDWPYWSDGGMGDVATRDRLRSQGRRPLAGAEALAVLYRAMASTADQWLVVVHEGSAAREVAPVAAPAAPSAPVEPVRQAAGPPRDAAAEAARWLKRVLAARIKRPVERIDAEAPMEDYGIDSILVLQLTADMEKTLGPLSRTLFFEHQTLAALALHLARSHPHAWQATAPVQPAAPVASVPVPASAPVQALRLPSPSVSAFVPGPSGAPQDVAIVGIAGRYPRGRGLDGYWRVLSRGLDCITEIPADRWDGQAHFDPDKEAEGKAYSKWGGFIEGVAEFDPLFFNISPREAAALDPQERLFLQCAHEAMEDGGYTRGRLADSLGGNVGVYVGVMYHDYQLYGAQEQARGRQIALSGSASSIANRVSYYCNLHGPSIAVDTMCSSSLTAIHLACESIRAGGCEAAIAGGVNISVHPNKYLLLSQGRFASSKGRCEAFGRGGDGYVPGEGVGAVLLKPLARAVQDGDRIYGVIKASALNHGGKTNGYSVPNPNAQAAVIRQALDKAGVSARAISYVEAHGTGTALGDPIEIAGLSKAFEADTQDRQYC